MPSEMKSMELLHGRINLPRLEHVDLEANWNALERLGSIALFEEAWGRLFPCWPRCAAARGNGGDSDRCADRQLYSGLNELEPGGPAGSEMFGPHGPG